MNIDLPDKIYYSIGEVATAFGVKPSLLRFWEKNFDVIQPRKNNKGNRLFTKEDLKNLQTIYHLVKERGYTLEGAQNAMKEQGKLLENIDLISKLEWIRAELSNLKKDLDTNEE